MKREAIQTDNAPKALGPYSQAIRHGSMLFVSGQLGLDPVTNHLASDDIESQVNQALSNVEAICLQAGTSISTRSSSRSTSRSLDFAAVNQSDRSKSHRALSCSGNDSSCGLPLGALIEIDAIVAIHAG